MARSFILGTRKIPRARGVIRERQHSASLIRVVLKPESSQLRAD